MKYKPKIIPKKPVFHSQNKTEISNDNNNNNNNNNKIFI